jgi:hypothetical protein
LTDDETISRRRAADDLMEAIEEWAKSLGDLGVTKSDGSRYFPSRQMSQSIRKAHREGRLFESLTSWLPKYSYKGGTPYANRMRDIVEHGATTWEAIVAASGRSWSPYITDEQRRVLLEVEQDVRDEIARGTRLRDKLEAERRNRR